MHKSANFLLNFDTSTSFRLKGMAVGLITTTTITHASPAGLYAHVTNRMWEADTGGADCDDIAKQFVRSEVPIDVSIPSRYNTNSVSNCIDFGPTRRCE